MKNYRFTSKEIEQMKDFILTSINNETEKRTAWRARLCYEMEAQCSSTKKSRDRGTRMLALYEQLTTNDLPNWLPTDHTPDRTDVIGNDFFKKYEKELNEEGIQTNFDALLGMDIFDFKKLLGYWWVCEPYDFTRQNSSYNFFRVGRGNINVCTKDYKITSISGWAMDKVVA